MWHHQRPPARAGPLSARKWTIPKLDYLPGSTHSQKVQRPLAWKACGRMGFEGKHERGRSRNAGRGTSAHGGETCCAESSRETTARMSDSRPSRLAILTRTGCSVSISAAEKTVCTREKWGNSERQVDCSVRSCQAIQQVIVLRCGRTLLPVW